MKKKIVSILLCVTMVAAMAVGCGSKDGGSDSKSESGDSKDKKYKVGITIQSLSNAYWAGVMGKLEEQLKAKGWDYTLIDCEDNSATQVSQIENFITSGCDLIMVHPSDAAAVENICKEALDADIKVMCWDDPMENTTANWVLDNTELGKEIGKTAAEFINDKFTSDDKAQVTVIGYPSTKVLKERADGIKEGLKENCKDNYEVIAEVDGLEAPEAQSNVESVLSAHPDANVFVGVGAGAMIGSNEALLQKYGKGKIPENVGVITTDVTEQQLNSLKAGNEAVRSIVGFEGSNEDTAKACMEMYERILSGEKFEGDDHNVYRTIKPITTDNIDEILKGM
ncbi:sugar ABC transporter substrate-binding protein [Dorea sp.]